MAENQVEELPKLTETLLPEREELFIKKLQHCCILFDLTTRPVGDKNSKVKEVALREMTEYIRIRKEVITEAIVPEIFNMFSCNVFRTLPPSSNTSKSDDPDEEPLSEDVCIHLLLVYDFFFVCLDSPDFKPNVIIKYMDEKFVVQLLELFDSENSLERRSLKCILIRIYRCILDVREFIRKHIINTFCRVIYETESHNGMSELLRVVGSIIASLEIPLTAEYKVLLKVLISLHKLKFLNSFHSELLYCLLRFISKDASVTETVVYGLLRLWPKMNSPKELLFLKETQEILNEIDPDDFQKVMIPLFRQIAKCITSPHARIAENALLFLNDAGIMSLVYDNNEVLLPILFPAFYENSGTRHWSRIIRQMNYRAIETFMKVNREMFDVCFENHVQQLEKEKDKIKEREAAWIKIGTLADETLKLRSNKLESAPADEPLQVDDASLTFKNLNLDEVAALNENVAESTPADMPLPVDEASLTYKNLNLEEVAPLDEVAESAPANLPLPVGEKLKYDVPGYWKRGPIS